MSVIVFEGIDGTGKSTQARMLEERLAVCNPPWASRGVVRTAEPTDSVHGRKIRAAMDENGERLSFEEELSLFIEDRKINVARVIKPALERGKIVILDRYYFSTAAYQGCRGAMPHDRILALNEEFAPRPTLLFFFLVEDVNIVLDRIDSDGGRNSRSYMERKENLERVQAIFKSIHESGRYHSVTIDATRTVGEIHGSIWRAVENYFTRAATS